MFQHDATGTSTSTLTYASEADLDHTDDDERFGGGGGGGGAGPSSFAGHQAVPGTSVSTKYTHYSGPNNTNQAALVDLVKYAEHCGSVTLSDAEIYMQWCQEYNVRFHLDFGHPGRGGYIDRIWHVHIGPVNHLPISPVIWID